MTFIDAAIAILTASSRPLTWNEVTAIALERRLIATAGRTPAASMAAALYTELGRPAPRVEKSFVPGPTRAARGSVRWTARGARQHPIDPASGSEAPS